MHVIDVEGLQQLFTALQKDGYALVGPTIKSGAIVFDKIESVSDLPKGWTDTQGPAAYDLSHREDEALFGFVIGPVSWKRYLFPPRVTVFSSVKDGKSFTITPASSDRKLPNQKLAFIGIRPCELKALAIHDKVFLAGGYADPTYKSIRETSLLVSVNCTKAGGTCFCNAMDTGPKAESGFDLSLTEILDAGSHRFLVEEGSEKGSKIMAGIPGREATEDDLAIAEQLTDEAAEGMHRLENAGNIKQLLYDNFEHAEWDEVAKRCLTCANCTLVCPTCFCSTVEDATDLSGTRADRVRRWDSCLTMDFARVAGGNLRPSARSRYRQWVTHKFAYWVDQFGVTGCVGCGRCITWCPVGIDITQEIETIRNTGLQALSSEFR